EWGKLELFHTMIDAASMWASNGRSESDNVAMLRGIREVVDFFRRGNVPANDSAKNNKANPDPNSVRDTERLDKSGGLGIQLTMENDLIRVIAPIDDTPAARTGILADDIITKLDGEAVQGLTLSEAVQKMRGPVNSKIRLTIRRKGQDKAVELTLVR